WFVLCSVLYLMLSRHARSPLFPYTTLFRSLSGAEARVPEVVSLYNESREMFAPGGFAVARLALDSRDSWSLTLDNGVEVVVGSQDRKSTRLNSSHVKISYAVFCLKKKQ